MPQLEQYFSGQQNWERLSDLAETYREQDVVGELAARLDNKTDIAGVIFHKFRQGSLAWIEKSVPALDGLSARECCKHRVLTNRLKEMLMRMPA